MTAEPNVYTLDLLFQDTPHAIASYLIPHQDGGLLIESGPGSTQARLQRQLSAHGLAPEQISDVLLTHIHLDHAGAAGWLARHGARIHVHHVGAPHMIDPEKLLSSAERIYGDKMDQLWGEFLPVPEAQVNVLQDGDRIPIGDHEFLALDTPGHAYHHMAYLWRGTCFSGDIGGVRIPTPGPKHLRIPMPPPGLHLGLWRESIEKLQGHVFSKIAPTHFGIYPDVDWHLDAVLHGIAEAETWMRETMPQGLPLEELRREFIAWSKSRSLAAGLEKSWLEAFEEANPSGMSADGLHRYWVKHVKDE